MHHAEMYPADLRKLEEKKRRQEAGGSTAGKVKIGNRRANCMRLDWCIIEHRPSRRVAGGDKQRRGVGRLKNNLLM